MPIRVIRFALISVLGMVVTVVSLEQASLGLMALSWGGWLGVHVAFQDKVNRAVRNAITRIDDEAKQLLVAKMEDWDTKSRASIRQLSEKYATANQPKDWLNQGANLFLFAGVLFLSSLLSELGSEFIPPGSQNLNGLFFASGILTLSYAAYHTSRVIGIVSKSEVVDPKIASYALLFGIIAIQAMTLYLLYIFLPAVSNFALLPLIARLFVVTLFVSLASGFAIIIRVEEIAYLTFKGILALLLLASPWFLLAVALLLSYFGLTL